MDGFQFKYPALPAELHFQGYIGIFDFGGSGGNRTPDTGGYFVIPILILSSVIRVGKLFVAISNIRLR